MCDKFSDAELIAVEKSSDSAPAESLESISQRGLW